MIVSTKTATPSLLQTVHHPFIEANPLEPPATKPPHRIPTCNTYKACNWKTLTCNLNELLIMCMCLQPPTRAMNINNHRSREGESVVMETSTLPASSAGVTPMSKGATKPPPQRRPLTGTRTRAPSPHPQLNSTCPLQQPIATSTMTNDKPPISGKKLTLKRLRGQARIVD